MGAMILLLLLAVLVLLCTTVWLLLGSHDKRASERYDFSLIIIYFRRRVLHVPVLLRLESSTSWTISFLPLSFATTLSWSHSFDNPAGT